MIERRSRAVVDSKITEKRPGEEPVVLATVQEIVEGEPVSDKTATVSVTNGVKMSANFQTVETSCSVTVPAGATKEEIDAAFEDGWNIVEEQLEKRAQWSTDLLKTLGEARKGR